MIGFGEYRRHNNRRERRGRTQTQYVERNLHFSRPFVLRGYSFPSGLVYSSPAGSVTNRWKGCHQFEKTETFPSFLCYDRLLHIFHANNRLSIEDNGPLSV